MIRYHTFEQLRPQRFRKHPFRMFCRANLLCQKWCLQFCFPKDVFHFYLISIVFFGNSRQWMSQFSENGKTSRFTKLAANNFRKPNKLAIVQFIASLASLLQTLLHGILRRIWTAPPSWWRRLAPPFPSLLSEEGLFSLASLQLSSHINFLCGRLHVACTSLN